MSNTSVGKIVSVIGPVIDVQFSDGEIPDIYTALSLTNPATDEKLVCEVAQHVGDGVVRAIAMSSTEGVRRGVEVQNTGAPISVPVGAGVLGRILNVLGEPIDNAGPVKCEKRYPIHRAVPAFHTLSTKVDRTI